MLPPPGGATMPVFGLYTTNEVAAMFQQIVTNQTKGLTLMSQISDAVAALRTQVSQQTQVEQSALTLIQGIAAQLAAALANAADDTAAVAAVGDIVTQLKTSSDALAAAVAANTTPTPPPAQP